MTRLAFATVACGGLLGLFTLLYVLFDLRAFELRPLYALLGVRGLLFGSLLVGGLVTLTALALARTFGRGSPWRLPGRAASAFLVIWSIAVLWLADWVFLERPLTVRIQEALQTEDERREAVELALQRAQRDGSLAAFAQRYPQMDRELVAVMLARVAVNRPAVFDSVPIGRVIVETAERYDVSPVLLLHWTYIDSFYGEAPAGPMPYFAAINAEMFRDLVQVHLPPWFIESRLRVALIEGPLFSAIAPDAFARKLRYAVQKASYDIAISPYMNSVMSDLLLILREYPAEFPELFGPGGAGDPLARAFAGLRDNALLQPYHDPYSIAPRSAEYYEQHRADLISFARAAVYRLGEDFRFATKVQALVARYYSDQYAQRIGPERWEQLSERQRTSLLAMLRDVYVPSIGRVSYNLYMTPEFNTTPIVFLAGEAASHFEQVADGRATWTPADRDRLWGATGLMLRVLSQVWDAVDGAPLPRVIPADTLEDSLRVLARRGIRPGHSAELAK